MATCRCKMCGAKNAGGNTRRSYLRTGMRWYEDGSSGDYRNKKHSRKVRRIREKRSWKRGES